MALAVKIVFWLDTISGLYKMGLPEQFPAPPYHEKIVCGTAHEAERISAIIRKQEASLEAMKDEERERVEGEFLRNLRGHMHSQMANARNAMNRDFLRYFLQDQERRVNKTKMKRESYLHYEAHESRR
jgi:hypothetical protein